MTENIEYPPLLFITGIDTDAGKSYATGRLARHMMEQGLSVITQKFVQTGNVGLSEDIEVHRKIMGVALQDVDERNITAPVIFSYPASPDLAARIDNRPLELSAIDHASGILRKDYDHVLIEGAGGLMVPLIGEYLTLDYIRERRLPVVLVTNGRLGSINHTLLSLKAIKDEGLVLFAVMYNTYYDSDKIICKDTRRYIRTWLNNHFPDSFYWEF